MPFGLFLFHSAKSHIHSGNPVYGFDLLKSIRPISTFDPWYNFMPKLRHHYCYAGVFFNAYDNWNIFKSSSTSLIEPIWKVSTSTFATLGDRNVGNVGPK